MTTFILGFGLGISLTMVVIAVVSAYVVLKAWGQSP